MLNFFQTNKKDLTSIFLPATNKFGAYSTMPLFSIISDLCAHPSYKLLACRSLCRVPVFDFSQKLEGNRMEHIESKNS